MKEEKHSAALAEEQVAALFRQKNWEIEHPQGRHGADLVVRNNNCLYVAEIKSISSPRPDRAIPLLSQAILQARKYASSAEGRPLAVLFIRGESSESAFNQLKRFADEFAPDVAVGVIAEDGRVWFKGHGLDNLNVSSVVLSKRPSAPSFLGLDLFSDLNQWMLKVLLAPEISPQLLSAPRSQYKSASELAKAAGASKMSASRLQMLLREEGFVDESSQVIRLVRRRELLRRWQSAALRPCAEIPMRALFPGSAPLSRMVSESEGCLGLFAAAHALKLGHVDGVPPYVYLRKLPESQGQPWKGLVPAIANERVDVILRQPRFPKSVFRGALDVGGGMRVSDAIQVWLDVSAHPSRGSEQAEVVFKNALANLIEHDSE